MGLDEPLLPRVLNDPQLIFLHGDRVPMETAGAGRLAQGGTHPSGKLRKIVGLQEPLECMPEIAGVDEVVPLRHQIVQRTAGHHSVQDGAGLAEGDAALHTARPLAPALLPAQPGVELTKMPDALLGSLRGVPLARIFQKSGRLAHYCSPPLVFR